MPGLVDHIRLGAPVAEAAVLCVFVHGRNQSPEEMQEAVIRHLRAPDVGHVLPRADDRCWYNALAVAPLTDTTRDELGRSLADLGALVASLRAEAPGTPLLLAGFSQGACLALEHAFAGGPAQAVAALTGCRVGADDDTRPAALAGGLPVYLTGGQDDPWIPLPAFARAAVELGRGGAKLRTDVFPARPHEVSAAEIAMLDAMLADLGAGRTPRMEAPR
jgi:phospholipase/carboxylesterase